MVTLLRPLDVKLLFENRTFKLGEAIDLTIELDAKRDVEMREGRVDLTCEVSWAEVNTVMVPIGNRSDAGAPAGLAGIYMPTKIPKTVYKEHKDTYAHSSLIFLQDVQLQVGTTRTYQARLQIEPDSPENAGKGTVSWSLVATIDVARARDVTTTQQVDVTLG